MEEEKAEIIEPFQLHFSDLLLLSSSSSRVSSSSEEEELERLECLSRTVMETLGPSGPGLLAVTGIPKASKLRSTLLPLARKLALLDNDDCRRVLKEHSLGTDVSLKNPERIVSSFAMQLKYVQNPSLIDEVDNDSEKQPDVDKFHELQDIEFTNLGNAFKELGLCMMEIGIQLARVCDKVIGGRELEQSILDSCTAKGRLIHYHSTLDNRVLRENVKRKVSTKGVDSSRLSRLPKWPRESWVSDKDEEESFEVSNQKTSGNGTRYCRASLSNLWQQWHYDYGIFTVLTAPMFFSTVPSSTAVVKACMSYEQDCLPPNEHSYLQIFNPNTNSILVVRSPPDSFIIQVGESADILSNGNLRSTLHSVCRPEARGDLSREAFVVFLQPAWDKTFSISRSSQEKKVSSPQCSGKQHEEIQSIYDSTTPHFAEQEQQILSHEICKIVPPLSARLKDGMTFAEFSRQTTKQYYGGSGMQSKR